MFFFTRNAFIISFLFSKRTALSLFRLNWKLPEIMLSNFFQAFSNSLGSLVAALHLSSSSALYFLVSVTFLSLLAFLLAEFVLSPPLTVSSIVLPCLLSLASACAVCSLASPYFHLFSSFSLLHSLSLFFSWLFRSTPCASWSQIFL